MVQQNKTNSVPYITVFRNNIIKLHTLAVYLDTKA